MTHRVIQLYRGTEAQNDVYTGSIGELTMDTTNNKLRLHDGSTAGGHEIGGSSLPPQTGHTGEFLTTDGTDVSWGVPYNDMIDYVVEKQEPNAGNNYTWYRKYRSGRVEQGGRTSNFTNTSSGSSGNKAVTLPITMVDKYYSKQVSLCSDDSLGNGQVSGYSYRILKPNTESTTGFTIAQYTNGPASGTACYAEWEVKGKAAS